MSDHVCEVCGAPACCEVNDIRETVPTRGEGNQWWRNWAKDGPPHHFCAAHRRDNIVTEMSQAEKVEHIRSQLDREQP